MSEPENVTKLRLPVNDAEGNPIPGAYAQPLADFIEENPHQAPPSASMRRMGCTWCGQALVYDELVPGQQEQALEQMTRHDLSCPGNPLVQTLVTLRKLILRNLSLFECKLPEDVEIYKKLKEQETIAMALHQQLQAHKGGH